MKKFIAKIALVVACVLPFTATAQNNKTIAPAIINIVNGSVHFVDSDGNGVLNAGEKGRVVFKVRNDGTGDGVGCRAVVTVSGTTEGITAQDKVMPTIPAGREIEVDIPIDAAANTDNGNLKVSFKIDEPNGFGSDKVTCDIPVQQKFRAVAIQPWSLKMVDDSGDGKLEGNETANIVFTVSNDGKTVASGYKVRVRTWGATDDIAVDDYTVIPDLPVGNSREIKIPLKAGLDTKAGTMKAALSVMDPSALFTDELTVEIPVAAYRHPKLEVVAASLSQSIARRAPFTLELTLKNTGAGPAKNVSVDMSIPDNVFFTADGNKYTVESLAPGESVVLKYNMIVNNDYVGTEIVSKFDLNEKNGRDGNGGFVTMSIAGSTSPKVVHGYRTFTVNGVSFTMVQVKGGTFTMGATPEQQNPDSDEKPTHQVTLSSYWIGETEVTQALWQAVMGSNPSYRTGDNLPVEKVSWNDCQEFVKKLNALTGLQFRLPTEAEWEFAARGGTMSRGYQYSGSNNIGDVAWYDGNSGSKTHPVATKAPNELGIYDMSGNVLEWCQDWRGSYSSSSQTNPTGPSSGSDRVFRGGNWYYGARRCRSAYRNSYGPSRRYDDLGLRLAL